MATNNPLRHKQTEGDTAKIKHDSSKTETQCGEMLRGRSAQRDQERCFRVAGRSPSGFSAAAMKWNYKSAAPITRNRCGNLQIRSRIKPPPLAPWRSTKCLRDLWDVLFQHLLTYHPLGHMPRENRPTHAHECTDTPHYISSGWDPLSSIQSLNSRVCHTQAKYCHRWYRLLPSDTTW